MKPSYILIALLCAAVALQAIDLYRLEAYLYSCISKDPS
jgi:hypothetical protein